MHTSKWGIPEAGPSAPASPLQPRALDDPGRAAPSPRRPSLCRPKLTSAPSLRSVVSGPRARGVRSAPFADPVPADRHREGGAQDKARDPRSEPAGRRRARSWPRARRRRPPGRPGIREPGTSSLGRSSPRALRPPPPAPPPPSAAGAGVLVPDWPLCARSIPQPIAGRGGAVPTGQTARGDAIVDKLASERRAGRAAAASEPWDAGGPATPPAPRPVPIRARLSRSCRREDPVTWKQSGRRRPSSDPSPRRWPLPPAQARRGEGHRGLSFPAAVPILPNFLPLAPSAPKPLHKIRAATTGPGRAYPCAP